MVGPSLEHTLVTRLVALNERPEEKVGLLLDLRAVEHGDDPRFDLSLEHYLESWLGAREREVFRLPGPRLLILAPAATRPALENGAGALIRVLHHHGFGMPHARFYDLEREAGTLLEDLLPGAGADRAKALAAATPVSSVALGRLLEVERILHGADVETLLREEVVWSLADPRDPRPVLTELAVSLDELEARLDVPLRRDDWLRHEVASMLDRGLLRHIARDRGRAGRPFAFDLHTATVLDEGFGALAHAVPAEMRCALTVELACWEVGLTPPRVIAAAERLADLGFAVAFDHVPMEALAMLDLGGIEPAYVKAVWARGPVPDPDQPIERLRAGVERFGADRLVLWRCVAPAALTAGRAAGVTLFQGHAADAAVAAMAAGRTTSPPETETPRHPVEPEEETVVESETPKPGPRPSLFARLFGARRPDRKSGGDAGGDAGGEE